MVQSKKSSQPSKGNGDEVSIWSTPMFRRLGLKCVPQDKNDDGDDEDKEEAREENGAGEGSTENDAAE